MDLVTDLGALGFTEYEAKVYLALLADYPATGYQLSKRAGIPRSMVYEALGRLDMRGAVLKTEEPKATLYRPMPPRALLDHLSEQHRKRVDAARPGLEAIYTARDEGHLWTFEGDERALSYAREMIANARGEVMLVLTDPNLDGLRAVIEEAAARDVRVGALLTGSGTLSVGEVAYHPTRESELHKLEDSLVVVADEREILIAGARGAGSAATVTTNSNMVQIGRQFVWMELFAHRIFAQLGPSALAALAPADRSVFEAVAKGKDGDDDQRPEAAKSRKE
ncbi:MAG: TrmB family transcriptional regulator [Chloroflexi bacterium]|nr:TrmB family transcriptional regulator [Chloroflexota bacterium]